VNPGLIDISLPLTDREVTHGQLGKEGWHDYLDKNSTRFADTSR